MAWEKLLQDAKFRGVAFDVVKTDDQGGHDVARHAFPYRAGEEVEDLGLKAVEYKIVAVLWGDDYEQQLEQLLKALSEYGAGELVHPIYGVKQLQPLTWSVSHDAENVDHCIVDMQFIDPAKPTDIFTQQSAGQQADEAGQFAEIAQDAAGSQFAEEIATLKNGLPLQRIAELRGFMNQTMAGIRSQIQDVVGNVLDVINLPQAFAADLIRGVQGIIGMADIAPGDVLSRYRALGDDAKTLFTLPSTQNGYGSGNRSTFAPPASDLMPLAHLMATAVASEYAAKVCDVLAVEADKPMLSPEELEDFANTARILIAATITALQENLIPAQVLTDPSRLAVWAGLVENKVPAPAPPPAPVPTPPSGSIPRSIQIDTPMPVPAPTPQPTPMPIPAPVILATPVPIPPPVLLLTPMPVPPPVYTPMPTELVPPPVAPQWTPAQEMARTARLLRTRPVIEALKQQALAVQISMRSVLLLRPPLLDRKLVSCSNLHLLAHHWYGDYTRSAELLRLNPQIRNPNFIPAGEVLRGYSR
ncbi:MAG: DNA circularization N-terminal domain-containing protein [Proteobacteria bacterium]|nr:DNA circularization N-terminal domain-containing protein [Pseudomonadota bacterium]